jgi:hypothetical protein
MTASMKDNAHDLYRGVATYNPDIGGRLVQDIVRSLVVPPGTSGQKYRVDLKNPIGARDKSGQPWYAVIDPQGNERAYLPYSVLRAVMPMPQQQQSQQPTVRPAVGVGPS